MHTKFLGQNTGQASSKVVIVLSSIKQNALFLYVCFLSIFCKDWSPINRFIMLTYSKQRHYNAQTHWGITVSWGPLIGLFSSQLDNMCFEAHKNCKVTHWTVSNIITMRQRFAVIVTWRTYVITGDSWQHGYFNDEATYAAA